MKKNFSPAPKSQITCLFTLHPSPLDPRGSLLTDSWKELPGTKTGSSPLSQTRRIKKERHITQITLVNKFAESMQKVASKKIFICYRVQDAAGETGRLADDLRKHFEENQLFLSIDTLQPGVDFVIAIEDWLQSCDVLLVIIGNNFLGTRKGQVPRMHDPYDWLRIELATALKRGIHIVPVLVDNATFPSWEDLPEDIRPLLQKQPFEVSNKRWTYDSNELVMYLKNKLGVVSKKAESASGREMKDQPGETLPSDKTIFFSYSRIDSEFALKLAKDLQEKGKNIWIDVQNLRYGKTWDQEIQKALKNADSVLVIISESSVERNNVLNEIQYALDKGKNIIPVRITPCDLPINLYRLHYIDFTTGYDKALLHLLRYLNS